MLEDFVQRDAAEFPAELHHDSRLERQWSAMFHAVSIATLRQL